VVDGPFRVRDQVVDSRPGRCLAGVAGTAVLRGYMAIPLPYASALGVAGVRVAALGESTPMILRVQCDPCNAPSGLNEIINLYDQPRVCRLLPAATRCYPF
jgi:hypothetical protein